MRQKFVRRSAAIVALASGVVACGAEPPATIVEGRSGGELSDEGCDWTLGSSVNSTGLDLIVDGPDRSEGVSGVFPEGSDDPVWVTATTPCPDALTIVFGGVDEAADEVVMVRPDGERFALELLDAPGESWQAVFGERPSSWLVEGMLDIELVAYADGQEIARDNLRSWSG